MTRRVCLTATRRGARGVVRAPLRVAVQRTRTPRLGAFRSSIVNLQFALLVLFAFSTICAVNDSLRADDIRIDLDKPNDPCVKPRIDAAGFAVRIEKEG